jgi:hypothetical protein
MVGGEESHNVSVSLPTDAVQCLSHRVSAKGHCHTTSGHHRKQSLGYSFQYHGVIYLFILTGSFYFTVLLFYCSFILLAFYLHGPFILHETNPLHQFINHNRREPVASTFARRL